MKYQPGDILYVNRGLYRHYGIYAGFSKVIHLAASNGDFGKNIYVHEIDFDKFKNGDNCFVLEINENLYQYSKEETLDRARLKIGQKNYNLIFNNCEHFVYWCRTGKSKSRQVENTVRTIAISCAAILLATAIVKKIKHDA